MSAPLPGEVVRKSKVETAANFMIVVFGFAVLMLWCAGTLVLIYALGGLLGVAASLASGALIIALMAILVGRTYVRQEVAKIQKGGAK